MRWCTFYYGEVHKSPPRYFHGTDGTLKLCTPRTPSWSTWKFQISQTLSFVQFSAALSKKYAKFESLIYRGNLEIFATFCAANQKVWEPLESNGLNRGNKKRHNMLACVRRLNRHLAINLNIDKKEQCFKISNQKAMTHLASQKSHVIIRPVPPPIILKQTHIINKFPN